MVCFCSMMSGAIAGGKSTTEACNHLKASSFTGPPADAGSQQGPPLKHFLNNICPFHVVSLCGFLTRITTPAFQAYSKAAMLK